MGLFQSPEQRRGIIRFSTPVSCGPRGPGRRTLSRARSSPVFAGSRSSSMSGAAGGASHGSVVSVVGNVPSCVPGGRDGLREDLQIGVDESGRCVVLLNQLVQCARDVQASAARNALATDGASLARKLGHGDALQTATWGNHNKQRTCNVRHVPAVLQWAVELISSLILSDP